METSKLSIRYYYGVGKIKCKWWLEENDKPICPVAMNLNDAKRVLNFIRKKGFYPAEVAQKIEEFRRTVASL